MPLPKLILILDVVVLVGDAIKRIEVAAETTCVDIFVSVAEGVVVEDVACRRLSGAQLRRGGLRARAQQHRHGRGRNRNLSRGLHKGTTSLLSGFSFGR